MNPSHVPPSHVPTLTEVVEVVELTESVPDADVGSNLDPATTGQGAVFESPWQTSEPVPALEDLGRSDLAADMLADAPVHLGAPLDDAAATGPDAVPAAGPGANWPADLQDQIVQRVMLDLQRQIDRMLEFRLREVLTPILTQAADGIVRDARSELAATLRDVVARAVAQELRRH